MENKFSPELLEKARQTKSPEELMTLAKENGTELTEENAKVYFDQINKTGELADEELDNVSGGCDEDEPYDSRYKISPNDKFCIQYVCATCGEENCYTHDRDWTCATCIHIRYKDNGGAVCNNPNVRCQLDRED